MDEKTSCGDYELSGIEILARGVAVVNGHVLLCRPKKGGYTYLPGGHVEFGETSREALVREMREETGLSATAGDLLGVVESQFEQNGRRHCEISLVYRMTQLENPSQAERSGGIGDAALPACSGRGASPMRPQEGGQLPRMNQGVCPQDAKRGLSPDAKRGLSPDAKRDLSPGLPAVTALEDWIDFAWWPIAELDKANLLPPEMKSLISAMGSDPMAEKC